MSYERGGFTEKQPERPRQFWQDLARSLLLGGLLIGPPSGATAHPLSREEQTAVQEWQKYFKTPGKVLQVTSEDCTVEGRVPRPNTESVDKHLQPLRFEFTAVEDHSSVNKKSIEDFVSFLGLGGGANKIKDLILSLRDGFDPELMLLQLPGILKKAFDIANQQETKPEYHILFAGRPPDSIKQHVDNLTGGEAKQQGTEGSGFVGDTTCIVDTTLWREYADPINQIAKRVNLPFLPNADLGPGQKIKMHGLHLQIESPAVEGGEDSAVTSPFTALAMNREWFESTPAAFLLVKIGDEIKMIKIVLDRGGKALRLDFSYQPTKQWFFKGGTQSK